MRFIQKLFLLTCICWGATASATLVGPGTKPVLYVTQQVNLDGSVSTVEGRTGAAVLGEAGVGGSAGSTPIAAPAALPSVAPFELAGANSVSNVQSELSTFAAVNGPALTAAMGAYATTYGFSSMWFSFTQPIMVRGTDAAGNPLDTERQILWSVFVDGAGRGSWADPRLIDPDPSIVHITYYTDTLPTDMPAGWKPANAGLLRYVVRDARTFAPRGAEVVQDMNGAFDQPINDAAFSSNQGFNCLVSTANAGCNPAHAPFSVQGLIAQTGASYALVDYIYALEPDYEKVNDPYCTNRDAAGFCLRARGIFDYTLRRVTYCGCAPALFENVGTYRLHLNQYGDRFMIDGSTLEVRPLQRFQTSFLSPQEAFSHNMTITVAEAMALANKVIHPIYGNRLMESEELGPPGEVTSPAIEVVGFLQNSLYWYTTPDPTTGAHFSAQALCEADTLTLRFVAGANVGGDPATDNNDGGFQNPNWAIFPGGPGVDNFSTTFGAYTCGGTARFNGVTTLDFFLDGFAFPGCRNSMLNAIGIGNICQPGHSFAPPRANNTTGEGCAGPAHSLCGLCPPGATGIFTEPRNPACDPQVVCTMPGPTQPALEQSYPGYRTNWGVIGSDCPWIGEVYGWVVGAWSPWSDTCSDNATRTRIVQCRDELGNMADWALCIDRLGPPPHDTETGPNYSGCTFVWDTGPWSAWSSLCDTNASRSRVVRCLRSDGRIMSDGFCPVPKPNEFETAAIYDSCTYAWVPDPWSPCSGSPAVKTRTVPCVRSNGDIVADGNCSASPKPPEADNSCGSGSVCDCQWEDDFAPYTARSGVILKDECVNVAGVKRNAECWCDCHWNWVSPSAPENTWQTADTCIDSPSKVGSHCDNTGLYNWAWNSWSACSPACGPGTRTRSAYCATAVGSALDNYCTAWDGPKPADETEACNMGACGATCSCMMEFPGPPPFSEEVILPVGDCRAGFWVNTWGTADIGWCTDLPTQWEIGGWSACSSPPCGGFRTRTVSCYQDNPVLGRVYLPDYACGPKPATSEACSCDCECYYEIDVFPFNVESNIMARTSCVDIPGVRRKARCAEDMAWEAGGWSACSPACGPGTQTRTVRCMNTVTSLPMLDEYCETPFLPKPIESQACNNGACTPCDFCIIPFAVDPIDNYIVRTDLDEYTCQNATTVIPAYSTGNHSDGFCVDLRWSWNSWSECSAGCTQTRTAYCDSTPHDEYDGSDAACELVVGPKPADQSQACTGGLCVSPTYSWSAPSPWSACSVPCGGPGVQTRTVQCLENGVTLVAEGLCDAGTKPATSQGCNNGACVGGCSDYPRTDTYIFAAAGFTCPDTTVGTPVLCTPFTYTLIAPGPGGGTHNGVSTPVGFQVVSNTCSNFTYYGSGATCTVVLRFNPPAAGTYNPSVTVSYTHSWTQNSQFCATNNPVATSAPTTCTNPITGGVMNQGDSVRAYQQANVTRPATCVFEDRVCQAGGTVSGSYTNARCDLSPAASDCVDVTGGAAGGTAWTVARPVCPAAGGVCTPAVVGFGPVWLRGYGAPASHAVDGTSCGTWSNINNYTPTSNPCTMPYQWWGAGLATWPRVNVTATMTTGIMGTWTSTHCGVVRYD